MPTYSDIINDIKEKEIQVGIYEEKLLGFSFWRILRSHVIDRQMSVFHNFESRDSQQKVIKILTLITNIFKSLFEYSKLFIKSTNKETVVFAFPRLQKLGDFFIDKFTDPVILNSNLKNNCLVFQRPLSGLHKAPRYNNSNVLYMDFFEFIPKIFGVLLSPFILPFLFFRTVKLYMKAKKILHVNVKDILKFHLKASTFLISYAFHKAVLNKIKPKRVFFVSREVNYPIIVACNKLNIETYELQHGVTHANTILYSGKYDPVIDPDYFLVFGELWKGPQFGIPVEKIINIGWAYPKILSCFKSNNSFGDNTILVISEPTISTKLLDAITLIAEEYSQYEFHIRLHPQEKYGEYEMKIVNSINNIEIVDNSIEANLFLMAYKHIVGVNSSVLYEAISLNKNVGRIAFNGCKPHINFPIIKKVFTLIEDITDFTNFVDRQDEMKNLGNPFYSEFNMELFNKIL